SASRSRTGATWPPSPPGRPTPSTARPSGWGGPAGTAAFVCASRGSNATTAWTDAGQYPRPARSLALMATRHIAAITMPQTHLLLSLPDPESYQRVTQLVRRQAPHCRIIETPQDCSQRAQCRWLQPLPGDSLGQVQ